MTEQIGLVGADTLTPMDPPGTLEAAAAAITTLTTLLARVIDQERATREACAAEIDGAERTCGAIIEKIDADHSKESRTLTSRHALGREQIEKEWAEKIGAAVAARDKELTEHRRRTQELTDKANKEHDERHWLADTMAESADRKARQELTTALKQADLSRAELGKAMEACAAVLKSGGYAPIPEIAQAPAVGADDTPGDQLAKELSGAMSTVGAAQAALRARAGLLWTLWFPTLSLPPLAAAIALLASVLAGRKWPDGVMQPVAISAGATFFVMLAARTLLRLRVGPAVRAFVSSVEGARLCGARVCANAEAEHTRQQQAAASRRAAEIARAEEKFESAKQVIAARQSQEYPELERGHNERIADLERFRSTQLEKLDATAAAQLAQLKSAREDRMTHARAARDSSVGGARLALAAAHDTLAEEWRTTLAGVGEESSRAVARAAAACPPWEDARWETPRAAPASPDQIFLGALDVDLATMPRGLPREPAIRADVPVRFAMPLALDVRSRGSLLIHAPAEARRQAIGVLSNAMLRLVTGFPPGKVRFTIVDPVGLGESFAGFMHLADFEPIVVGDRIWTDPRHIEQRLTDLTEHMEHVIQKYLRNQYETIQEYNAQAGEVAEPLRFLVLADYPANLTEVSIKKLQGIIASGPRCGVFTLIAADPKQKGVFATLLQELEKNAVTLAWKEGALRVKDPVLGAWPLALESAPEGERLTSLLTGLGALVKDSSRVQVPFSTVAPDRASTWTLSSAEELRVPLGRAGARKLQYMTLGRGMAQHALVAGRTGSGKSTLFHVLITNLAQWYSPDEVEFYLIDFKKGVEFRAYATHSLPHARVVAVESEREFGLSVLKRLDAELTRRGQLFRELGVQDIAGFRRERPGARMPRVLLAVDEFQEFFVEDDKLAQEAALLLDRLVRQGRAFGMHLVLGSQTLGGAFSIARSTIGQMAVRIALQSSEQDSYLIMSEDNTAPRLLTRPGEAIYNDQSGMVEGNSPFQIVWLSDDQREHALAAVSELARTRDVRAEPPIVFEGNVPAHVGSNHLLARAAAGQWPASLPSAPHMWLGDAISIKDPSAAVLHRRGGGNMLIVGQQEDGAGAMELVAGASLLAHAKSHREAARILVLDATNAEGEGADALRRMVRELGEGSRVGGVHDLGEILAEVAAELAAREADPHAHRPPLYLFIHGLHRFRDLRKSDDFDFSSDPDKEEKPADRLSRIAREGPSLGIHVIAWCDGVNNLERYLSRQTLREFAWRVVFQMSASDSTHLIDSPIAQSLGRHRAYLYSDETAAVEKFRPYSTPPDSWWREVLVGVAR